ncbi:MAG: hypothetical protein AABW89_04025 [Nanoarchaeota archaeon]
MNRRNRKGQEEIVGFILIVVLIAVAFVIFIGIKLRNPETVQKESEIIYQFIESSLEQTTNCALKENGKSIRLGELIKECYSANNLCLSGENSCDASRSTFENILNASWKVGSGYPYKGYELKVNYEYNSSNGVEDEIFSIVDGNCNQSYSENSYWLPEFPGTITVKMKLCF